MKTDGRKGRTILKRYNKVCKQCGVSFIGVARAIYCTTACRRKLEYNTKSLDYKWRLQKLLASAKNRANVKGLPFNLTLSYLTSLWEVNRGCCEVTGQEFDLSSWGEHGQVSPTAPSIDRITPRLGYVEGNVRLITYHLNVALSDFGIEELRKLTKLL